MSTGTGKTKKRILSCIFSEKIYFQENGDAAISYHQPIVVLMNASKVLEGSENKKEVISDLLFNMALLVDEIGFISQIKPNPLTDKVN